MLSAHVSQKARTASAASCAVRPAAWSKNIVDTWADPEPPESAVRTLQRFDMVLRAPFRPAWPTHHRQPIEAASGGGGPERTISDWSFRTIDLGAFLR